MDLTKEYLYDNLKVLLGQKISYSTYQVLDILYDLIDNYVTTNKLNRGDFDVYTDKRYKWTIKITYKKYTLVEINVKRGKSTKHHNFYGSYCDYVFKNFEITIYMDSVTERMASIDKLVSAQNDANALKLDRAKTIYAYIKKTFNLDDYEARSLVSYMNDKRYYLN